VPHTAKSSSSPSPAKTNLAFEEALTKLESAVESLESGELSLEAMIARYEEGMALAKVCQQKLAEAELKIQQLEKTSGGELKLKPVSIESGEK
jgi:exodeoxyribonuclease VII small subunit